MIFYQFQNYKSKESVLTDLIWLNIFGYIYANYLNSALEEFIKKESENPNKYKFYMSFYVLTYLYIIIPVWIYLNINLVKNLIQFINEKEITHSKNFTQSNSIKKIQYNSKNKQIYIHFKNNNSYRWDNIDFQIYLQLTNPNLLSIGKEFNKIRKYKLKDELSIKL